jgi:outer membrane receptor protein involved in Fe transport
MRARRPKLPACRTCTCRRPTSTTDRRTEEKTKSAFLQFNTDWDTALPIHTAIGVRYEQTDVVSTALVPTATASPGFAERVPGHLRRADLHHPDRQVPPPAAELRLRHRPAPDMKLRFSYGETIGRPRYDQIQGGQVLDTLAA